MSESQDIPLPLPQPDESTQFFWDGVADDKLTILRCQDCGNYIHYPKPICDACHSRDLAGEPVSGRATLYTWTEAVQAFHPYWRQHVPYLIATVELVEQPGLMMTTQLIDYDEDQLKAGMALEVVFKELAPEFKVPFFRPVAEGQSS